MEKETSKAITLLIVAILTILVFGIPYALEHRYKPIKGGLILDTWTKNVLYPGPSGKAIPYLKKKPSPMQ